MIIPRLVQVVQCKETIGWRDNARHLLLFSTDDGFHHAGDGKLGGIVKPNDGRCHLDDNGNYTQSTELDYPSVPHINKVVKEGNINIIFAIAERDNKGRNIDAYEQLSDFIDGSSTAILSDESSNIVELIKSEYRVSKFRFNPKNSKNYAEKKT